LYKKIVVNQDLIFSFEKALNQLEIEWPDWDKFKRDRKSFEWDKNEIE
jgi:hypothetical protein